MNKTRRLILITLALTATLLGSLAADAATSSHEKTAERISCAEAPVGEFAECLGVQIAISEVELDAVFKSLLLREAQQPAFGHLKDAQSKWRSFRDAQCTLSGFELRGYDGQTAKNPVAQQCLLQMTEERIKSLQSLTLAPARTQVKH